MQDRSLRKTNPSFSPDGKRIAFGVWRSGTDVKVWLMNADGKNAAPLTTASMGSGSPGWISNDEVVYVAHYRDRQTLSVFNLATGIERTLCPLDDDMDFIRVSPNGGEFAYNSTKSGTINAWKSTVDNGRRVQLTFDRVLTGWPAWSPDGRQLAVELKNGDDTNIAVMPSEGGPTTQLTFEQGQNWPHSWSPDGSKIAFAAFRNGVWNIFWVSVRDKTQRQITNFNKSNSYVRYPAWSPTGNQIVFEYAEMTGNIWMMELR
jgi:TolB protein